MVAAPALGRRLTRRGGHCNRAWGGEAAVAGAGVRRVSVCVHLGRAAADPPSRPPSHAPTLALAGLRGGVHRATAGP